MRCPNCRKEFEEVYTVHTTSKEPFTGIDPMEGLTAYGAYSVAKELVCHYGDYVHFRFLSDGEERLVRMVDYNPQALSDSHQAHEDSPLPCEHENCKESGMPCYINWLDEDPNAWYCSDHAYENGFCSSCGIFSAGIESFDFMNPMGVCANCHDQIEAETDDWYDENADFGWEYPEYEDILADETGGRYIGPGSETLPDESEETE